MLSNGTLLILLGFVAVAASQTKCPDTWSSFGGSCYSFMDVKYDWNKAESFCKSLGGHLASIHSRQENEFVAALPPSSQSFWIGLNDKDWESEFVWSDGDSVVYTNWSNGEPDDRRGQDCAAIDPTFTSASSWDDEDCTNQYTFVCKMTV
ncbi:alpha-N-acetylgalactosamine-specific lectin-like [Ptychodera flava]|uniref:alpha-N-acetylgalactosamine-specific lectin-like n=1 Tax=Ptychodera flava TaxID=63121 RepID=UPI00396A4CD8